MAKAPALAPHPLLGLDVEFNGEPATVVEVYDAIGHLPERAMVELHHAPGRLPVVPTAKLKIVRSSVQ